MRSLLIAGAAVVVAVALFLVLRPDDSNEPEASPATTTTTARTTVETTSTVPARVQITVRDGLPAGGVRRVTVAKDRRVILLVTSDVTDEVHLHGYNLMRDVGPGQPARIAFRATIVGTVEAELEDRGVQIAQITTKP
ncbi:MAG TPA: hypothetical protein VFO03_07955 [Gaiellaceae bacterium]|nr:hypothetical protein [Gaiellaceae bacterium]